jgi:hypothetical protein
MCVRAPAFVLALVLTGAVACGRGAPEPPGAALGGTEAPPPAAETKRSVPVGPPPGQLATKLPAAEVRAALPPLPAATFALPRSVQDVRLAYEFAGLHPEVLKYVPCFCGCEQTGHPHNESCFVARRDEQGRVVSWDSHGMG